MAVLVASLNLALPPVVALPGKTDRGCKGGSSMTFYRRLLIAFVSMLCFAFSAQSAPVSKHVQNHCVQDYKKYCHQWGLETKGLTNCMHKHGDNLNPSCVAALVQAGEVSQAEVNRRKQAAKK
jgi:hypothetical protein